MDKIKTVKIKNPDGSVSEETYTISVDARNVDMDNGKDLQDTIGTIDVDTNGTIGEQLNNLNENVDNLNIDIKKKIYYYNNVADMKKANLKVGDMVITLGYYEANDGGGAEYKIVNSINIYKENLNNGLYAELVIKDGLNVKQIGAKGNGTQDDTQYLQTAINILRQNIITNGLGSVNTILIPAGKYKITSTIILSPFVKIKTVGFTILQSYVSNGACLHLTANSEDPTTTAVSTKQDWFRGPWLNGESGLYIKYMGNRNTDTNAIGILIGSDTNINEYRPTSRYNLCDIRIDNFAIGMKFNVYNNYLGSFYRVSYELNVIGVQFGDSNHRLVTNSGEKMTFIDCLFSTNAVSIKHMCDGFDCVFTASSFDFNTCLFYDEHNCGYHFISLENCHIEGNGRTNEGVRGIVYGEMKWSNIIISNCSILNNFPYKMFISGKANFGSGDYCLSLINNKFAFNNPQDDGENPFLADDGVKVVEYFGNSFVAENISKPFNNNLNLLQQTSFNNLTTGVMDITSDKMIGNWYVNEHTNIPFSTGFEISEDSPIGQKSLALHPSDLTAQSYFAMLSEYIPVEVGKHVMINMIGKNISSDYPIVIYYYDSDKNELYHDQPYHYCPNNNEDIWYMSRACAKIVIPKGCQYIKIRPYLAFRKNKSDLKIGGIFVQYI